MLLVPFLKTRSTIFNEGGSFNDDIKHLEYFFRETVFGIQGAYNQGYIIPQIYNT